MRERIGNKMDALPYNDVDLMTKIKQTYAERLRIAQEEPPLISERVQKWFDDVLYPQLEIASKAGRDKFITGIRDERYSATPIYNDQKEFLAICENQGLQVELSMDRYFAVISWPQ